MNVSGCSANNNNDYNDVKDNDNNLYHILHFGVAFNFKIYIKWSVASEITNVRLLRCLLKNIPSLRVLVWRFFLKAIYCDLFIYYSVSFLGNSLAIL